MKTYPARYKDRFSEERTTILDDGEALSMVVRGVRFRGNDFDGFEPQDVADPAQLSSFTFLHGSLCFVADHSVTAAFATSRVFSDCFLGTTGAAAGVAA
jgi:hypothetical protein